MKLKFLPRNDNQIRVNLLDVLFLGWYFILDKTIYFFRTERGSIGPKEHSFFITFLAHGINIWTILRFALAKYFNTQSSLLFSLSQALLIFAIGYLIYFRNNRASKIIRLDLNASLIVFAIIASLIYVVASIYLMLEVGNYVRYQINSK